MYLQSHGTKTPCWDTNDLVMQENKQITSVLVYLLSTAGLSIRVGDWDFPWFL